ncbi:MAG TPA: hypothetical protein PK156_38455 [Polyangium sp.]|nr:hypothetical protein [Polyangium sp.]
MKETPEASPARDPKEPPDASDDASSDEPSALTLVRVTAIFAVFVVLIGRAFGSSLRGLAVGLGKHAERFEQVGAILSQGFLILGTIVSLGLVLAMLRPPFTGLMRFVVVTCGGLVTLGTLLSMATRMPDGTLLISATLASILALVAAWDTIRTPFAQAASIIVGGVGIGSVMRVIAIVLLTRDRAPSGYRVAAQAVSTVGLIFDVLAMAIAVGFVSSRSRKPSSPATIIALGAALVATRLALGGASEDAGAASIMFERAARALVVRPEPSISNTFVTFASFAAPALAIAVLVTPTLTPALSAAIALALLAHGAPDVPLCGLMLGIASVTTILAARDHRGIWTAIKQDGRSSETAEGSGEHKAPSSD